jgi:hypothetical protein
MEDDRLRNKLLDEGNEERKTSDSIVGSEPKSSAAFKKVE